MATKMGVLILHGIGSQAANFADHTIYEIKKRIQKAGHDPADISFVPVHWAPVIDTKEKKLWEKIYKDNELDWIKMRQFIISALGDAVAYNQRQPNEISTKIHKKIHEELLKLRTEEFENQDKPIVFMGHSLGSHIISNYIWDRQNRKNPEIYGGSALERMETLTGIITFGSNIPLFTLALSTVESITLPPEQLPANLKQVSRWNNYYDPDDALGFPLKPVYEPLQVKELNDYAINSGNILSSWNIMSHNGYWTDNDFTKPVAKYLIEILSKL